MASAVARLSWTTVTATATLSLRRWSRHAAASAARLPSECLGSRARAPLCAGRQRRGVAAAAASAAQQPRELGGGWVAVFSAEHQREYFWHQPSGAVSWTPPTVTPSPNVSATSAPLVSGAPSAGAGSLQAETTTAASASAPAAAASAAAHPGASAATAAAASTAAPASVQAFAPAPAAASAGAPATTAAAAAVPEAQAQTLRAREFPAGWCAVYSAEHGREYYWHRPSGATSWEPPSLEPSASSADPGLATCDEAVLARFRDTGHIRSVLSKILKRYPLDTELPADDFRLVLAVLRFHPDASVKIGAGLRAVKVDQSLHDSQSRCFWALRVDGSAEDFSARKCLEGLRRARGEPEPMVGSPGVAGGSTAAAASPSQPPAF